MFDWQKADWIYFWAVWVFMLVNMLVADHFGKLSVHPKLAWMILFPPFIVLLMVLRSKAHA